MAGQRLGRRARPIHPPSSRARRGSRGGAAATQRYPAIGAAAATAISEAHEGRERCGPRRGPWAGCPRGRRVTYRGAGVTAAPARGRGSRCGQAGRQRTPAASALRIEVGELARDRAQPAGEGMVEHPGLDRDTAVAVASTPQRPGLLWVVDQRRGADQPVAAGRGRAGDDPVAMDVAGDRRDHAGMAVKQLEELPAALGAGQRLVADDDDPALPGGGELRLEPVRLAGVDKAAGAATAACEVEHQRPDVGSEVAAIVEQRPARAVPMPPGGPRPVSSGSSSRRRGIGTDADLGRRPAPARRKRSTSPGSAGRPARRPSARPRGSSSRGAASPAEDPTPPGRRRPAPGFARWARFHQRQGCHGHRAPGARRPRGPG